MFEQYNGVEVGVQQGAVVSTIAGDSQELNTRLTQIDIGTELDRSTVREAVVCRRTSVVVAAAVSWRRRTLDCLVFAVVQFVVVVQRQSRVVDAQVSAIGKTDSSNETHMNALTAADDGLCPGLTTTLGCVTGCE